MGSTTITAAFTGGTTSENTSLLPPVNSIITDEIGHSPSVSVFGDLMVGQRHPDIISKFAHGLSSNEVVATAAGIGNNSTSDGALTLSTGAATNSSYQVKSLDTVRYIAGHAMYALFTAAWNSAAGVGSTREIGFTNGNDGVRIIDIDGVMRVQHLRTNGTAVSDIPQSEWGDKLDGTGASGLTIDFTKMNIFQVTLGHLGIAPIRLWIHNGKKFVPFHSFYFANLQVVPHLVNPYLKIITKVTNTTKATDSTLVTASWNAGTMHGIDIDKTSSNRRFNQSISVAAITTERPVFSVRNKTAYPTGGLENFVRVNLRVAQGVCEGNGTNVVKFKLYRNATLNAGTTTYSDKDNVNSCCEFNTGATGFTGGVLIWNDVAARNVPFKFSLIEEQLNLYPNDSFTLTATSATSAAADFGVFWIEEH